MFIQSMSNLNLAHPIDYHLRQVRAKPVLRIGRVAFEHVDPC